MTWLYLSLASALCFACLNILSRIVSIDSKNPRALSLVFNFVCTVMAIILFLLTGSYKKITLPTQIEAWIYFFIASVFYALYERLRFYVSKVLNASINSIIGNLAVVIAFIISLFLYKELLTLSKAIGFILIMVSLFLVIDRTKSKISLKGIILGLIASVFVGIGWGLDKKGIIYFNLETYNVLIWFSSFIILCLPNFKLKDVKIEIKKYSWKIILLSFFNVAGYYLMLKAFELADATKVIPVTQLSVFITVIAGIFFLNEKSNLTKKILAGMIAVLGVFLLR